MTNKNRRGKSITPKKGSPGGPQQCVACKRDLPKGATLCAECGSYQRPWMNHTKYAAGLTALVTVVLAAVTFGVGRWPQARAALWPRDDVRLVALHSRKHLVLANFGDRPIFVEYVHVTMTGSTWKAQDFPLYRQLDPEEFVVHEPRIEEGAEAWRLQLVRGLEENAWATTIEHAISDREHFVFTFHGADDQKYRDILTSAKGTLPIPAKGFVVYRPAGSERVQRRALEVSALLWKIAKEDVE